MLSVNLNKKERIAILQPDGELSAADFQAASQIIDPFIESSGKLNGIIIYVQSFPGWDSFSALITHLKFIQEHHKLVLHVALVTDSPIGGIAEYVTSHFVSAKVNSFAFGELSAAEEWITLAENK